MSSITWPEAAYHLVVAVAIIVVGYVLGKLLKRAVSYTIYRVGGDEWLLKLAVGRAIVRAGYAPSEFFGRLAAWLTYIGLTLLALNYLGRSLAIEDFYSTTQLAIMYFTAFLKALVIMLIGFILIDAFVGYVYKSSELKREDRFVLAPVAEYLRIIFYIVVIVFALAQGGIHVEVLSNLLTPVIWGLTIIIVIVVVGGFVERILSEKRTLQREGQ